MLYNKNDLFTMKKKMVGKIVQLSSICKIRFPWNINLHWLAEKKSKALHFHFYNVS